MAVLRAWRRAQRPDESQSSTFEGSRPHHGGCSRGGSALRKARRKHWTRLRSDLPCGRTAMRWSPILQADGVVRAALRGYSAAVRSERRRGRSGLRADADPSGPLGGPEASLGFGFGVVSTPVGVSVQSGQDHCGPHRRVSLSKLCSHPVVVDGREDFVPEEAVPWLRVLPEAAAQWAAGLIRGLPWFCQAGEVLVPG